jgi:hypothetical protein
MITPVAPTPIRVDIDAVEKMKVHALESKLSVDSLFYPLIKQRPQIARKPSSSIFYSGKKLWSSKYPMGCSILGLVK